MNPTRNPSLVALAVTLACITTASAQVAVKAKTLITMAGAPIENGVVVIEDGKVTAVGPAASVAIPSGCRVLEAAVVTPGLIDAHGTVGFSGALNQPHDQDQIDASDAIQPELRAIDAFNPDERLVGYLRSFGITTVHVGHAPGPVISGQTLVAKTKGGPVADCVIVETAMIAARLGDREGRGRGEKSKDAGTRAKAAALLREALEDARDYGKKRSDGDASKRPDRNLRKDALLLLLDKKVPLLVTAERHQDIETALRIAKEFDLRLVLDGGAEAPSLIGPIHDAGVPVIVHATMARPSGERENATFEDAAKLKAAGIQIALQSGFEGYVPKTRVVLLEAGVAAANGLSRDEALAAITIDAAKILGVDARVGSLAVGKDGDVALYDGDPLEYTTHCVGVVIDGKVVSEEKR